MPCLNCDFCDGNSGLQAATQKHTQPLPASLSCPVHDMLIESEMKESKRGTTRVILSVPRKWIRRKARKTTARDPRYDLALCNIVFCCFVIFNRYRGSRTIYALCLCLHPLSLRVDFPDCAHNTFWKDLSTFTYSAVLHHLFSLSHVWRCFCIRECIRIECL